MVKNFSNSVDVTKLGIPKIEAEIADLSSKVLPDVTSEDNGKVLKVSDGTWGVGSDNSLPDVTSEDNGKVLKVSEGAWGVGTDNSLPDVTSEDNGKVLKVSDGTWGVVTDTPLPEVTSDDNGKVLQVVSGEWSKSAITLATMQSEITNIQKTLENLLNPLTEKLFEWDFTDTNTPLVDVISGKIATNNGCALSATGAFFDSDTDFIKMEDVITSGRSFVVEFGDVNITNANRNFCIAHTCQDNSGSAYGFVWSSAKQHYIYGKGSDIYKEFNSLTNINVFKNGKLEIKRISNTEIEIYVNDQYMGNVIANDWILFKNLYIGTNGNSFYDGYVKKVTVYG